MGPESGCMTSPVRRSSMARAPLRVETTSKPAVSVIRGGLEAGRLEEGGLEGGLAPEAAIGVFVTVDRFELLLRKRRVHAPLDGRANLGHQRVIVTEIVNR